MVETALERFKIVDQKALKLAECSEVPAIMIIAGPNGVGKSTLLYSIKRRQGEVSLTGRLLYISPHRIWRRQQIRTNWLWQETRRTTDFLMQDSISGFEGLRILDGTRSPDSADEALSAVKYTLSQFETRKQSAVNKMLESKGHVSKEEVGDVYSPVRELFRYLLPHLEFSRIDISTPANVRCLFNRTDIGSVVEIDIDDLSSGERSVVSLFMPFLEREIEKLVAGLEGVSPSPSTTGDDLVVIIDEPELHLHPLLQIGLLEYLRSLTSRGGVQFVLATHSPSLVESATYDELFVLMPVTRPPRNQLVQLADSSEKLTLLRALCGESQVMTACRDIICVEGEQPAGDKKGPSDVRLLELLCPNLGAYVLAPFGGKAATIEAARRLRELLPPVLPVVSVLALVDSDTDVPQTTDPWVHRLPVAMVENLLLVPASIWAFLAPYREKIELQDEERVEKELRQIASSLREEEVRLRVLRKLKLPPLKVEGTTPGELRNALRQQFGLIESSLDDKVLEELFDTSKGEVDKLLAQKRELDLFRGKRILTEFYEKHVKRTGISKEAFIIEVARIVSQTRVHRDRIQSVVDGLTKSSRASRE